MIEAKIDIRLWSAQKTMAHRQQAVGHGDGRAFDTASRGQPPVSGAEVAAASSAGSPRRLGQGCLEPAVGLAGFAALAFAGGLVVARAQPRPGGQVLRR